MENVNKEVTFAHIDGEIVGIATIIKDKIKALKVYNLKEGLEILKGYSGTKSVASSRTISTIVSPKSYIYPIEGITQPTTPNSAAQVVLESKNYGAGDIATALQFYGTDSALYESLEGDSVAFATPGGWLQDLNLDDPNIRLLPHIFALNESPGLHLHIGWNSCDLTLIENGKIRRTKSFDTGGLSRVARLLGPRGKELLLNELNEESTPSSDSELYTFAEDVFSEYFSTLDDWGSRGVLDKQKLHLHGFGTMLRQIVDIMRSEGVEPYLSKDDEEKLSLLDKRLKQLGFMFLLLSRKRINEMEIILLRSNRKDTKAVEIKAKKNNINKYKLIKAIFAIVISGALLLAAVMLSSGLNKTQISPPSEENVENSAPVIEKSENTITKDSELNTANIEFEELGCENQIGILIEFITETPDITVIKQTSSLTNFKKQMIESFTQCGEEGKNVSYELFYNDQYYPWTVSNNVDKVNLNPLDAK